jgi:hypothetical protein
MHFQTKLCNLKLTSVTEMRLTKKPCYSRSYCEVHKSDRNLKNQKHTLTNGQKIAPTKQASQLMNANRGKIPFQEHETTALTCSILKFKSIRHQK